MKVYITKYVFTTGIEEKEAEVCDAKGNRIRVKSSGFDTYYHGKGRDWHMDMESAIARAKEMRLRKIASLEKQLAKVKKLSFAKS